MFAFSVQHKLKLVGIALAVPLSLFLTLMAVLDLPTALAHPDPAAAALAPHDVSARSGWPPLRAGSAALLNGADISIVDFAFSPSVITITAGTVVTWTNAGAFAHTTTSDAGSLDPWDSGSLGSGGIFTRTFNIPGTYGYHCTIHLSMKGTIVVLAPPQAPIDLDVAGPSIGVAESAHAFTATVSPITTTQPITYLWEATGQAPVTHATQGLSDTLAFTWTAAQIGPHMITVTAMNAIGSVSTTHSMIIAPPASAGTVDVAIVDFAFQPQAITITTGSSVRWFNAGQQLHTATSDVGSLDPWDSGNLNPGGVFTKTFNTPGIYAYHCAIHPGMTGAVTVLTQVYLPLVLR